VFDALLYYIQNILQHYDFKNNEKDAKGKYIYSYGDIYEGDFKNDNLNGNLNSNLNSNNWDNLFLSGFDKKNVDELCDEDNNKWHHVRSYYANTTGSSIGVELMEGSYRFKSDWSSNNAQGYMEFLDSDIKSDEGWTVYPIGGMSQFIRTLYKQIIDNDYADIYCGFNVEYIEKTLVGKTISYKVYRRNYQSSYPVEPESLSGDKIIITVPVQSLFEIGGVVDDISSSIYSHIWNPIEVLTCSQQFEQRWWENLVPKQYGLQNDINVDDIEVDVWFSKQNCMQRMENFNSDYLRSANVIRSLYVDEGKCFDFWKSIIIGSNYDYNGIVADEIRARHAEYFGVNIEQIPKALSTRCELFNDGWYALGVGATYEIGNNPHRKVEEWASKPLKHDDIFMCGETFTVRHAWTDGCRINCDLMMNNELGVDSIFLKQWEFSLHERAVCSSICDDEGTDSDSCIQFADRAILK